MHNWIHLFLGGVIPFWVCLTNGCFQFEQAVLEGEKKKNVEDLKLYLGLAWAVGSILFGLMVIRKSSECSIARQYLVQASLMICGVCVLALSQVQGFSAYVIFIWVYGIFLGGFNYSLKMYLFEKVRARHFPHAWGFVQCSQALSVGVDVPITGYRYCLWK